MSDWADNNVDAHGFTFETGLPPSDTAAADWPHDVPGYAEWAARWEAMTDDERAHELQMMDEHGAEQLRRREAGEAP